LRRKFAEAFGLVLVSLAIAFLGIEFAVRAWQRIPLTTTENFIIQQLDIIRQNTGVMELDTVLGWRLKDNLYAKGSGFTTGPYGLRMNSNEIRQPAPGGILAVGDSFTAGSGVIDDDSWPAQLEKMIHQPVHNAAAGAWGVDQMVLRAEQLVPILQPQVLIISILAGDSQRNAYEIYGGGYKPYFVLQNGEAVLQGVPVPRVAARPMDIGKMRKVLGHSFLLHWTMMRWAPVWWVHDRYRYKQIYSYEVGVEVSCRLMARLLRLREEYKLRVIVAMQYGAAQSSGKQDPIYGPAVLTCAKQRGLETLDTYPALKVLADQDPQRFRGLWLNEGGQLGHMSAAGNQFAAELFRDILLKR
jgi:hypothetical protein